MEVMPSTGCMIQCRGKGAVAARDSLYQDVLDDHGVMQRRGSSWTSPPGHVLEVACDYIHVSSCV